MPLPVLHTVFCSKFFADSCPPIRITIDFQARVNTKHIDLYKLWNRVKSKGGYDAVSCEKLAWRKVGLDFSLGTTNAAAYAFALKTTYYKNLA